MEPGVIVLMTMIALALGVVIGILIGKEKAHKRYITDIQYTQGTLNVDDSDPEFEPNIFLGLAVPVSNITSRKYVMLDVNVMTQDSHE